jgi:hypothetical protein
MSLQVPNEAITNGPYVLWTHIDGPLMTWACNIHWLTLSERLRIALKFSTVDQIACSRWPHLAKVRAKLLSR